MDIVLFLGANKIMMKKICILLFFLDYSLLIVLLLFNHFFNIPSSNLYILFIILIILGIILGYLLIVFINKDNKKVVVLDYYVKKIKNDSIINIIKDYDFIDVNDDIHDELNNHIKLYKVKKNIHNTTYILIINDYDDLKKIRNYCRKKGYVGNYYNVILSSRLSKKKYNDYILYQEPLVLSRFYVEYDYMNIVVDFYNKKIYASFSIYPSDTSSLYSNLDAILNHNFKIIFRQKKIVSYNDYNIKKKR